MMYSQIGPWGVLLAFCAVTWLVTPRRVTSLQFFDGRADSGQAPSVWLVAMSAAITWVFAKSIANASGLAGSYGLAGGIGYTLYYLSFVVAGVTIYFIRTQGGFRSLPHFLISKYGMTCARMFMLVIAFRLFNEVWSNTKVMSLYFGSEGSASYWVATVLITLFTIAYAWRGGMRATLTTDRIHIFLAFVLLGIVLAVLFPPLLAHGLPTVPSETRDAGLTFCVLALVQIFSYPFHDPVLTDRAFLNPPRQALKSFLLAAVLSGSFIFLFSFIGIYSLAFGMTGQPSISVPASIGLPMLMAFNAMMLLSGGSTIDSTFTSVAKLVARDWRSNVLDPTPRHMSAGRIAIVVVAVLGNLPLLTLYLGDKVGPAIIAATTISGTMVIGLAPIFLLWWMRAAGRVSFHLAFWPGVVIGILRAAETFGHLQIFPAALALGRGTFALDLGVNVYGTIVCFIGYLLGVVLAPQNVPDVVSGVAISSTSSVMGRRDVADSI
jgi:solute:Na+ symporter, SSS family